MTESGSNERIMLLDTLSNSCHTRSVMWLMSFVCLETEKKTERWQSKQVLQNNDIILTGNLPVYIVGSTLVGL